MAITLRSVKGANLTANEVDNNFTELSGSIRNILTGTSTAASASTAVTASHALTASYAMNASGGGILYENSAGQVSTVARLKITNDTLSYGVQSPGGGSGNTGSLSVNLSAISAHIEGDDIIPTTDGVYDLGSSANKWFDGYFTNNIAIGNLNLSNDSGSLVVDTDVVTTAISADIANIGSINIIEDTITADTTLGADEYASNQDIVKIGSNLKILGSIYGSKYIFVQGAGTPAENGLKLLAAYDYAKELRLDTPATGSNDRFTVVVSPGDYYLEEKLLIDTDNIDVVSLTGQADVIIKTPYVENRAEYGGGDYRTTPVHVNEVENVTVRGINVGINAMLVRTLVDSVLIENCVGGENSFTIGGYNNWPAQQEQIYIKGTFKNCIAGDYSYAYFSNRSACKFINCTGGNNSFGYFCLYDESEYIDCKGGNLSFSSQHGEYGSRTTYIYGATYTRCTAGNRSFGHFAASINSSTTFTDCVGTQNCFGSNATSNSGYYLRCKAESIATNSIGGVQTAGTWKDCVATGGSSWTNIVGGIYDNCYSYLEAFLSVAGTGTYLINCVSGPGGFGSSFANAIAINCVIYKGSGGVTSEFATPQYGAKQINCVHGDNVLINR